MFIERIAVWLLDLPLREPFTTAHGTTTSRELVIVRIDADDGHGWGECSALPDATYSGEHAAGAFRILVDQLAPRLVGHRLEDDPAPASLSLLSEVDGQPMAKAAAEMAVLDIECRAASIPLAERLGATRHTVAAGAAIGLAEPARVAERASALADEGFRRVKLKIEPGHDLAAVTAVRTAVPSIEVQVDGNGSYGPDAVDLLAALADGGVSAIEQPFPASDLDSAVSLVAAVDVPVVADEAAASIDDVARLHSLGALSGVSIKPPRVGGIGAAVEMLGHCVTSGLSATAGGMVECGLGRHALAAVAALDGFTLTGDLSPARRWLAADPWPDLTLGADGIAVPGSPGVTPDPDPDVLVAHTVRYEEVTA